MRILDMTTFVVLARNRHFGRTAEEMHTTQPAISSRLNLLEQQYGCRLVHRGDREFRLTPEGERVLQVFQDVLGTLDDLRAALKEENLGQPYIVRVGAIDSVASTWLAHFVETLHEALPNLRVELTVEGTKDLIEGINKGELDLIFGIDPAIGEGFRSFVACVFQMIWAGSPKMVNKDREYTVEELANMPIITFPKGTPPYTHHAPYFLDERVLASKMTSSNSLFAIINLLIDGFGVGAIPTVTIERELATGLLNPIKIVKPFPPMPIVASYSAAVSHKIMNPVIEYARRSASDFCERSRPGTAWMI